MRFTTIYINNLEHAGIVCENGILPIGTINQHESTNFATSLYDIIVWNQIPRFKEWWAEKKPTIEMKYSDHIISLKDVKYAPLYRYPKKIWGIGLNYREHAQDLGEDSPKLYPGSFMKGDSTIISIDQPIMIPSISHKTTGEAELGIVIGSRCKNVKPEKWLDVVAGFVPIIDMTAEDILRKNPRFLTLSKNFDSFLSIGPYLITPDEISDLENVSVATVINNKIHAKNQIKNMTFSPQEIVVFHSQVMTLHPGDLFLTGTPQAVELHHNDQIACHIDNFPILQNPVIDLKKQE